MRSEQWAGLLAAGTVAVALGLPVGLAAGLVGAVLLAPKDFPPPAAAPAGPAGAALSPGRSGSAAPGRPTPAPRAAEELDAPIPPAVTAARERLLAVHSEFLRRERAASAVLDRYRPAETRPARRPTPALRRALERTLRQHAQARAALAAEPMPVRLAEAHAATLRMLEYAEAAYGAVLEGARTRDPDFALRREPHFARALAEHYAALAALRNVPARSGSAPGRSPAARGAPAGPAVTRVAPGGS